MSDKKILIAVPAMDIMPVQTAYSMLSLRRPCPSRFSFIVRASCHDARNLLAREAMESKADMVLWIDSDMVFEPDMLERMMADLEGRPYFDMVCGLCFKRELPTSPVIYEEIDAATGKAIPYSDYPRDAMFKVAGCGFGAVLMRTDLLRRVKEETGELFGLLGPLSEDLSFCARAAEVGAWLVCDSRIKVGHVGQIVYGEEMYRR